MESFAAWTCGSRARASRCAPERLLGASPDEALCARAILARLNEPKAPAPVEPALHASTLIRPWFGMSRGDDGKTRADVRLGAGGASCRASVCVTRQDGSSSRRWPPTARSSSRGAVAPTGPAALDGPGTTPVRAVFDVAPGRLRLRMTIQDVAAQEIDRDVRELSIRDLRGGVAIGTPEVLRSRNAREFRTLDVAAAGAGGGARVQPNRASPDSVSSAYGPSDAVPDGVSEAARADGTRAAGADGIAGVDRRAARTRSICRSPVSPRAITRSQ
mgnify:CR=1 FL=1